MARQRFETEVPDGLRLGSAADSEGGVRGLLFHERTNRLVRHARFFPVHDGDSGWHPARGPRHLSPIEHRWPEEILKRAAQDVVWRLDDLVRPHLEQATDAGADWVRDKLASAWLSAKTKLQSKLVGTTTSESVAVGTVSPSARTRIDNREPQPSDGAADFDGAHPTMSSAEARQCFGHPPKPWRHHL